MRIVVFLCFSLLLASCASKPPRISADLSYQQIAPRTFVVTDETFHQSNVLVSKMLDGTVIIVSSPYESVGAEALYQWIQKKFQPKKVIAINPHFHSDGTGGNAVFAQHGVEIWSSDLTRKFYLQTADVARWEQAKNFKGELAQRIEKRAIHPADNVFKLRDGLLLNFGGEKVEVFYPGPAHTRDNVAIYLPQHSVLFGGCMIRPGEEIGPLRDADLDQWENSLESLTALNPAIVIPGHGAVGDAELLQNTRLVVVKARRPR